MLKNYLLVTLRNIFKNKIYSFINIAGLSIGIACSILILLWVFDELSYDKFHSKSDRLYQVRVNSYFDGHIESWNSLPLPTSEGLRSEDFNIKRTASSDWGGDHLLTIVESNTRINKRGFYVGEEFLSMFDFPLVKGSQGKVLLEPNEIIITESLAKILFGEDDAMNKIIRLDNQDELKVTGILKDVPPNSSFQFDYLLPWKLYTSRDWVKRNIDNWGNYSFQAYVELSDPSKEAQVERKIIDLLERHGEKDIRHDLFLHPLERWRLYSRFEEGQEVGGQIDYVRMFSAIAIFILVIACINFMNLATARSEKRSREVGIRKSVGSRRIDIVFQFIGESMIISVIAFVTAVLLSELALPMYNNLVEKKLFIDYTSLQFWLFAIGLTLFTGIISGSYPAFYLSSFQPAKVLKGKLHTTRGGSLPRKILVTLQFGFAILLIIGTIVIYQQIQFTKARDLGYNQENIVTIDYNDEIRTNYRVIKTELLATGVVNSVTRSNSAITEINSNNFLGWPGKPEERKVIFTTIACDYDYLKTMGIKLLEGRDFSEDFKSDSTAIIVNKAGMDLMNLENPLGTQMDLWGIKRQLVGIVDNVLMGDPAAPVKPMFIVLIPDWINKVTIRLEKTDDIQGAMEKVEEVFKKHNAAYPFEFSFADVDFQKKFKSITMTSTLATSFAFLAIIITGLGLFGLAAFTAEQRNKEVGIRKVMGATVGGLVALMSKDFSRLVMISFLIAAPTSWWLLNQFLQRFEYRIQIEWWIFPLTGLLLMMFALTIVATQAYRAAQANPIKSLRSE